MQPHPVITKIDSRSNWPSIWFRKQSLKRPAMCVLCLSVFFFSSSPGSCFLFISSHGGHAETTRLSSPGNPVFPPPRFLRCHVRIVATAATWPLIWSPSLLNRHVAYMVRRLTLVRSFRCVLGFGTCFFFVFLIFCGNISTIDFNRTVNCNFVQWKGSATGRSLFQAREAWVGARVFCARRQMNALQYSVT
jgi:hypothetical protein